MMASSFLSSRRKGFDSESSEDEEDEEDFNLDNDEDGWTNVGQKRKLAALDSQQPHKLTKYDDLSAKALRDRLQQKIEKLGEQQNQMIERVNRMYGVKLKVQVLQAAFTTNCPLNLRTISERCRNAVWDSRSNSVIVRIHRREPLQYTAHFQLYPSGKVTVLGTRSIVDMYREARFMARRIQKCGFPTAMLKNFRIRNLTGSCRLPFSVSLAKLNELKELQDVISYDPESFPRVVIRMINPKCTVQVFAKGSILFGGVTAVSDMCDAFHKVFPLVKLVRAQVNLLDSALQMHDEDDDDEDDDGLGDPDFDD